MPFFPTTGDRVAVLDSGFNQVFQNARPLAVRVHEHSRLFDHPIETGQVTTDYAIVLPIEIEIPMMVEAEFYQSTYQQIKSLYLNKDSLTVQTNTQNYTDMVIAEMPHEEKAEIYDALPITLRFRQIQLVPNPTTYAPEDPTQDDTLALGQQNGYTISGVATADGTDTISSANPISYSSVPPNLGTVTSVQTMNGTQTISIPSAPQIPVTGVQTITNQQSIISVVQ